MNFNPSPDESADDDRSWILNGYSPWDIGQFDPREMRQVRKLALEKGATYLALFNYDDESFEGYAQELTSILVPFSGLEELLLVDWRAGDLSMAIPEHEHESTPGLGTEHQQQHTHEGRELWSCRDVAEVDGLFRLFSANPPCAANITSTGLNNCLLCEHLGLCGNDGNYFRDTQDAIRGFLDDEMAFLIAVEAEEEISTIIPREIPQLRTVHVLSPTEQEILSQERFDVTHRVLYLQEEWATIPELKMGKVMSSSKCDELKRAFEEAHWPADGHWDDDEGEMRELSSRMQKKWWIQHGPIPDAGDVPVWQQ